MPEYRVGDVLKRTKGIHGNHNEGTVDRVTEAQPGGYLRFVLGGDFVYDADLYTLLSPEPAQAATPALATQVGGGHYKQLAIQPVEYILKNNIPFLEGNVIKYVTRWKDKGGVSDLDKAIHYLQLLKESL